ncbi:MAG TPA: pyridoxamine 5'-phosphate oxidase family protein [Gryllotalpicola sp.]
MTRPDDLDEWSPQGPVTELSGARCWELIAGPGTGRLGLSHHDQPEIFPVSYVADGSSIYFRTAEGTKLHDLIANSAAVLEVDAQSGNDAWSVTVKGTAHVVTDELDVPHEVRAEMPLWIPTSEYVFIRIDPLDVRGRRFQHELRVERREPEPGAQL